MTVTQTSNGHNGQARVVNLDAKTYPSDDALSQEAIKVLETDGCCIIRGVFDQKVVDDISHEVHPYVSDRGVLTCFQKNITTVTGMVSKSDTFARKVVGNEMWTKVRDHFLGHTYGPYWLGQKSLTHTTTAQMGSSLGLMIGPGAKAQDLHKDDLVHQGWNGAAEKYQVGRDVCCTFFQACTRTTKANGATRVVPGSHLWDYTQPPPENNDPSIVDAELEAGDTLIILGSLYHGGGANTTADEFRFVTTCAATLSYLRQEENQYLSNDLKKLSEYPVPVQKFVGFSAYPPRVGLVNWGDPLRIINPKAGNFDDNLDEQ